LKHPDLIIIGAGAAGLMCAITAAKRGHRVLVLERSNKMGKKILMSGGGRCNFTNMYVTPDRYLSANPHFCKSALSRYTQWDFIAMVEQHGIEYFEKETVNGLSGQLFCQDSSKQIVAMLLAECNKAGVDIRLNCETRAIYHAAATWQNHPLQTSGRSRTEPGSAAENCPSSGNASATLGEPAENAPASGFQLTTNLGVFNTEKLVIAAGGLSIPSLGGSGMAYELAESFGLRTLPKSAGLVPFTFTDAMHDVCGRLSGVSTEAVLFNDRKSFREDMLFTHRGLSGPVALQLSSYWKPGEFIYCNLLPDHDALESLLDWKQQHPKPLMRTQLDHHMPRKLVLEFEQLWWPGLAETPLAEWPNTKLEALAQNLNSWPLKPAGTEGYRTAEVTLGGVDTRDLSSKTMESKVPGLYFIGEAIDVTGHLGGFNFQWAWASGFVAGESV
jgi:predicted flavoprotein YhiN